MRWFGNDYGSTEKAFIRIILKDLCVAEGGDEDGMWVRDGVGLVELIVYHGRKELVQFR